MNKIISNKSGGWNWLSFILGPFWYLANGLVAKGLIMLFITLVTLGFGLPIIWIYCGFKGNADLFEYKLSRKSKYDVNKF